MPTTQTRPTDDRDFDYIVVGAGSAGSVLAARLTEDPFCHVALIDRGGADQDDRASRPAEVFALGQGPMSWNLTSAPQHAAGGHGVDLVTGSGIGGSSAINAMGWFHGQPADYAHWEAVGGGDWGWDSMLATLRRVEDHELGASAFHGAGGPVSVTSPRYLHPLALSFLEAGTELGWPRSADLNGSQRNGVSLAHSNIRDGTRHSVVQAYLTPALERPNLHILKRLHANRLRFDDDRAVGVCGDVLDATGTPIGRRELTARRGVILACGALRTPQLLMLSGIGPHEQLSSLGIPVVVDSPDVGRNLHDHPTTVLPFALEHAERLHDPDRQDPQRAYRLARRGPLSAFGQAIAAIPAGDPAGDPTALPDLHIGMAMLGAEAGLPPIEGPAGVLLIALIAPESRGVVSLRSTDPYADPVVDPRYLQTGGDREKLRAGVRHAVALLGADALSPHARPLSPPPESDEEIDVHIGGTLGSYYHYSGTARLGVDERSVLTPRLEVRGVDALWVADASVMPSTPRGLSQAPTIAVAEQAARIIGDGVDRPPTTARRPATETSS